ncbi:hypothetical protein V8E51_016178 [Hyaloscypha variabilis]
MSERPSRPPASHSRSSHRPSSSRNQSLSSTLPHSRPGTSPHESLRPQRDNDEDRPIIFVRSEAQRPSSHRTVSAPIPSARSSLLRRARSVFTSKPMSEATETRLPTARAPLMDNARTMADGLALPTNMQSVPRPSVVRRSNSSPPNAHQGHHQPSAFPASEWASSRAQTAQSPLMDIERTRYDGMAAPTEIQSVYHPTVAPSSNGRPSSDGRLGAVVRPGSNGRIGSSNRHSANRQLSNGIPSSNGGLVSKVEPTSKPSSDLRPSSSNKPSSNGTARPNLAPSIQMNGLVPIREDEQENEEGSYAANTALISNPPASAASVLRTPEDQRMASRQTRITTMVPAERSRQEQWAQTILRTVPHSCPQGHEWKRIKDPPGYHCKMGGHCITDELLAQGRGGICIVPGIKIKKMWPLWGPYYDGPLHDGSLVHGGDPNQAAPSFIDVEGQYRFDKAWRLHPGLTGPPTNQSEVERVNREYEKLKGPRPRPLTLADFHGNGRYR